MTQSDKDNSVIKEIVNLLCEQGSDGMAEALRILFNHAMNIERNHVLGAAPYQRTTERIGYANGFKPKTIASRVGELTVAVPQVRGENVSFYPSALEKGSRSERALTAAIAEMYVQGVSTRKVTAVLEKMCGGLQISSAQVSRATAQLDEHLEAWRNRPLIEAYPYLFLDARYEKVRQNGALLDCAILAAIGVNSLGKRVVLGVSVALSEAEIHWRSFLESLQDRGLHGVELIISDDHSGLRAARIARFAAVPWQRCQFHLQQNAAAYLPKISMRTSFAAELREVLHASSRPQADEELKHLIKKYEKLAPALSSWLETNVPESLSVLSFPIEHHQRLRTSNALERLNQEIKRRTRVACIFPNPASLLRLVSAIVSELSDEWQSCQAYLNMNPPSKQLAA